MTTTIIPGDWTPGTAHGTAATSVAQRLVVWAKHDKRIRVTHTGEGKLAFVVPDELAAAAAAGGYGTAIDLGTKTVTVTPGTDQTATADYTQAQGIDPNTYANETTKPTITVAVITPPNNAPKYLRVNWDYNGFAHPRFILRSRKKGTTNWFTYSYAGFERKADFFVKDQDTYEFNLQVVLTDRWYVPVASEVSATVEGTLAPDEEDGGGALAAAAPAPTGRRSR